MEQHEQEDNINLYGLFHLPTPQSSYETPSISLPLVLRDVDKLNYSFCSNKIEPADSLETFKYFVLTWFGISVAWKLEIFALLNKPSPGIDNSSLWSAKLSTTYEISRMRYAFNISGALPKLKHHFNTSLSPKN